MTDKKKKNDIDKMSFEEAIKELTNIVGKIEEGQIPLQDSLEQYEKGMSLIKQCRKILQKAEERIEKINKEEERDHISQKDSKLGAQKEDSDSQEEDPDELFK
jgi:exodeoxyribonuclease VII small subunit